MTNAAKMCTFFIAAAIYVARRAVNGGSEPDAKTPIDEAKLFVAEAQAQGILPTPEAFD